MLGWMKSISIRILVFLFHFIGALIFCVGSLALIDHPVLLFMSCIGSFFCGAMLAVNPDFRSKGGSF